MYKNKKIHTYKNKEKNINIAFSKSELSEFFEDLEDKKYIKIVKHDNYNPRIIEFVTNKRQYETFDSSKYSEFIFQCLNNPEQIWKNEYERRLNKRTVNNRINDERRAARISACVMGAGVVGCLVATGMKYTPDQLDAILKLEAQSLQSFEALKGYFASFSPAMLGSCVTAVSGAIHYRRHAREERNARRELNDMNEVEKELESR